MSGYMIENNRILISSVIRMRETNATNIHIIITITLPLCLPDVGSRFMDTPLIGPKGANNCCMSFWLSSNGMLPI